MSVALVSPAARSQFRLPLRTLGEPGGNLPAFLGSLRAPHRGDAQRDRDKLSCRALHGAMSRASLGKPALCEHVRAIGEGMLHRGRQKLARFSQDLQAQRQPGALIPVAALWAS